MTYTIIELIAMACILYLAIMIPVAGLCYWLHHEYEKFRGRRCP